MKPELRDFRRLAWLALAALAMGVSTSAPARADGLLAKIQKRGEIVVATEARFAPFEFVRDGKIVGYGRDILDYVVAKMGVKDKQLDVPFQGLFVGLAARKFDLVATSVAATPERKKKLAFTLPIATYATGILVRKSDTSIQGWQDLSGKVVGTQLGSAGEKVIDQIDDRLKTSGKKGIAKKRLFTGMPELHLALAGGQVDAGINATPTIGVLLTKKPGVYRLAGTFGESAYIVWVTREEDKDLRDFVNLQILALHKSGKLKAMQRKWFGYTMEVPTTPIDD